MLMQNTDMAVWNIYEGGNSYYMITIDHCCGRFLRVYKCYVAVSRVYKVQVAVRVKDARPIRSYFYQNWSSSEISVKL